MAITRRTSVTTCAALLLTLSFSISSPALVAMASEGSSDETAATRVTPATTAAPAAPETAAPQATAAAPSDTGTPPAPEAAAAPASAATAVAVPSTGDSKDDPLLLKGKVSTSQLQPLEQRLSELVDVGNQRIADTAALNAKHRHFSKIVQRAFTVGKDLAELATEYKGFEQSSEAADVVLGEKLKQKSKAACEYIKQQRKDLVETEVFSAIMQIAQGLGASDPDQGKTTVDQAVTRLKDIVGEDEAAKTSQLVSDWCSMTKLDPATFDKQQLSIIEADQKSRKVLDSAMKQDPVVAEIKHRLHKYNGRSSLARVAAKVLNTSLSIAAYSPTFISPAAQVAWGIYIAAQGGSEESKLLKEVYLGKRFESRFNCLNEQSRLIVNSYSLALVTKNPALMTVSQYMIDRWQKAAQNAAEASSSARDSDAKAKQVSTTQGAKKQPAKKHVAPKHLAQEQAAQRHVVQKQGDRKQIAMSPAGQKHAPRKSANIKAVRHQDAENKPVTSQDKSSAAGKDSLLEPSVDRPKSSADGQNLQKPEVSSTNN